MSARLFVKLIVVTFGQVGDTHPTASQFTQDAVNADARAHRPLDRRSCSRCGSSLQGVGSPQPGCCELETAKNGRFKNAALQV